MRLRLAKKIAKAMRRVGCRYNRGQQRQAWTRVNRPVITVERQGVPIGRPFIAQFSRYLGARSLVVRPHVVLFSNPRGYDVTWTADRRGVTFS